MTIRNAAHRSNTECGCPDCVHARDIVDIVKTALAGQCECYFTACVHDQVRWTVEDDTQSRFEELKKQAIAELQARLCVCTHAFEEHGGMAGDCMHGYEVDEATNRLKDTLCPCTGFRYKDN